MPNAQKPGLPPRILLMNEYNFVPIHEQIHPIYRKNHFKYQKFRKYVKKIWIEKTKEINHI